MVFTEEARREKFRGSEIMKRLADKMARENFVQVLKEYPQYSDDVLEEFKSQNKRDLAELSKIVSEIGCLFFQPYYYLDNAAEITWLIFMLGLNEYEVFSYSFGFLKELGRVWPNFFEFLRDGYITDLSLKEMVSLA